MSAPWPSGSAATARSGHGRFDPCARCRQRRNDPACRPRVRWLVHHRARRCERSTWSFRVRRLQPWPLEDPQPVGGLYSIDSSCRSTQLDDGVYQSNGHCFSPGGRTLYCADRFLATMYAYDYDIETGRVTNKRVFAETSALGGIRAARIHHPLRHVRNRRYRRCRQPYRARNFRACSQLLAYQAELCGRAAVWSRKSHGSALRFLDRRRRTRGYPARARLITRG